MRVALLTSGRFWLVDLGRELARLGHQVRLYSLVPPHVTRRYGLPSECNRWLAECAPVYAATRIAPAGRLRDTAEQALLRSIDRVACDVIAPCDVLVAMSGIGLRSLDVIRRRFGARVFLERGSRHILSQRAILEGMPRAQPASPGHFSVERELAGYALADVVTVPAQHVVDSFVARDFPSARLFLNPFGVSLETFRPTLAPPASAPATILMTGAWSLRKGCDVLTEAWRSLPGVKLLHVGPVVDGPLPRHENFEHVDAVPQSELRKYYERAHVFALASREEGLALVQVQALACGLPLVCTTRTGGADLRLHAANPDAIRVVEPDDTRAFAAALRAALANRVAPGSIRDLLGDAREQLSWRAYARRYEQRMLTSLATASPFLAGAAGEH